MVKSPVPVFLFITAEAVALLANSAFLVVFPWLVLSHTGDAGKTSLMTALVTIPTAVATLLGGRVIDRIGRKPSSVLAGLGCAVAAAGFGVVSGLGALNIGTLIALGMLAQAFLPPSTTARDALMDAIASVGGISLERLAGIRQVVFSLTYAIGPALAGLLLTAISPIAAFWIIAGAWTFAALLTTGLPSGTSRKVSEAAITPSGSVWKLLRSRRAVWMAVVIGFGASVITQPITSVLLPAHFRDLHQPQLYGVSVSAFGVGAILGALLYAAVGAKAGVKLYVGGVLVTTAGIVAFALLPSFWILALGLALGGLGSGLLAPMLLVAVTRNTADNERGQALGVYNAASLGASPIGLGLLSLLLQRHPDLHAGAFAVLGVWALAAVYALTRPSVIVSTPGQQQAADTAAV
ncbi:MFS transporter [Amycolatopsis acidiphila]|uniref:Multidrug efflux pump Tap n=1 Tax=Amycolatopsis acidiphila TaxID=715473 RepID=A0A557ZX53_9PSEU|nr:MFS transporter [Amycolatopsis acidiphila]TVT16597.1 MFS transporter [Amycolatopsis acidiphila]UIJ62044.1 MFS transporter [Amycolatopsis acidiphila]GHG98984.1 putative multidrug-efflux transporter [Amycolatopsis acidiphila]